MQDTLDKLARKAARLLPLGIALALASFSAAHAATLAVPAAYPTIQAAVNASQSGDTVLIADGTYTGDGNRDIDFGGKNITVTSQNGAATTIIDCGGTAAGNHRGFYLHSGETSAVINGLTIQNGYESTQDVTGNGGGILNDGVSVSIQNCVIKGNTSAFSGGVCNRGPGTIALTNCTIMGNTATGIDGCGGVMNFTSYTPGGVITLTGCTISGNAGGGVYNYAPKNGAITLTGCTITGNQTNTMSARLQFGRPGGGVYNETGDRSNSQTVDGSTITLTGCTVAGNSAEIGAGGVFNEIDQNGGKITMADCAVTGNTTPSLGGGVSNYAIIKGAITLTNCTIAGNTADYGGGVYSSGYQDVSGYQNVVGTAISLTNCTVTANVANRLGGGVFNDGTSAVNLTNDILYGNVGSPIYDQSIDGIAITVNYCDVQGGFSGFGNINADPLFVNAASDFHLQLGSPCLGAGTSIGTPNTDADGKLRPSPPSIGAYEGTAAAQATATHLLWTNPDGKALVWNVNAAGQFVVAGAYGPYTDGAPSNKWTATALATGPDGLSRLLWNNTDGRVALWTVAADGSFTVIGGYGPGNDGPGTANWRATALSVGSDNILHLLWSNPDGKAVFGNVAGDGTFTPVGAYGPFNDGPGTANWSATALATGPDGISHLLWNNPDGHMALWTLDAQGGFTPFFYGPYTDGAPNTPWTATAVSVGSDNVPHLLWTNPDGKALIWNVAADGTFTVPGVYGPYTDGSPANLWGATSLATGAGGLSHLLWNNPDGRVALWTVSSEGTFTVIGGYGPYTDGSPGTPWTAAAVSAGP